MKIDLKRTINLIPFFFSFLIIMIAILSWLGSIWNLFGEGCRNLIDGDGLRWFVANFMKNIKQAPWEYIFLITLTISVVKEAEILEFYKKTMSLKRKRAYMIVIALTVIVLALVIIVNLLPGNILLTAFGRYGNSPLQNGLIPLLALFLVFVSLVFGYTSGRFYGFEDMSKALSALMAKITDYLVTLIVAAQLAAVVEFAFGDLPLWQNNAALINALLHCLLFYLPWGLHVICAYRRI